MIQKDALRRDVLGRCRALPPAEAAAASAAATARLLALLDRVGARVVAAYATMPGEVDPTAALDILAARGTTLLLPRVAGPRLELVVVGDLRGLRPGFAGIDEPTGPAVDPAAVEAIIVPGVAFDRDGGRLGRGGGHYDRLLAALPAGALRVGVCFALQIVEDLPRAAHDEPVDVLVTEEATIWTGARGNNRPRAS